MSPTSLPLRRLTPLWTDARHYQIAALSALVFFNFGWIDFGARPLNSALAVGFALATQVVCARTLQAAEPRPALAADHRAVAVAAAARRRPVGACARRHHRDRLEIRAAHRRQAHLESGRLRHRRAALHGPGRSVDFARAVGHQRVVRGTHLASSRSWCSPRARRADMALFFLGSHAALLLARAFWLGDPLDDPAASTAERLAPHLRVLHDLRSAHHARFAARPLPVRVLGRAARRTISPSSCRCGRRSTSR